MITVPLQDGNVFVVIEPGNIRRLKDGKPLKVGGSLVCFTPDMQVFLEKIGAGRMELPRSGGRIEINIPPVPLERIEQALRECQSMPEVER